MPSKNRSFFDELFGKEANIWVTTIFVLLVLWFVISIFALAAQSGAINLQYNSSQAAGVGRSPGKDSTCGRLYTQMASGDGNAASLYYTLCQN